jgi:hypothetical protein
VGFYVELYPLSTWVEKYSKLYKWGAIMYVELPVVLIFMCENGNIWNVEWSGVCV